MQRGQAVDFRTRASWRSGSSVAGRESRGPGELRFMPCSLCLDRPPSTSPTGVGPRVGPQAELAADWGAGKGRISREYADVAQLVEHFTRNEGVRGSSPRVGFASCLQTGTIARASGHLRKVTVSQICPKRRRLVGASGHADADGERACHITDRHPEIAPFLSDVLRAVRSPERRLSGRSGNEEWCYARTNAPRSWLKVVVAYAGGRGHIVTAHARRSMP